MSFPEIGLAHDQKIEIAKKLDGFARNRSEFSGMSFPEFAN